MKKKILKTSLAFMLSITTIMTSSIPSFAMEVNDDNTEYQTLTDKLEAILPEEEIKEVNTIEQLDTKDVVSNDNSVFKSCRLIVYSESELTFKDDIGKDNIKSVQKLNELNAYVVTYSSFKEAEKAFNNYVSQGIEVEVDMVSDAPKGVENKDERDNEVEDEKIASTNENKDTKSLDKLNELEEKKDIVVAVLDTGLNDGEDIFTDRIIEGKNFVDDSDDVVDKNGHGTTMSRIVLTNVNNTDSELTEVDKGKTYVLPIKVLNDKGIGTTLSAYKGIKYAIEKKVDIINLSLSGIGHSKLLESAINEAYNNNIPVVVSSGNDNKEITDYTPANIDSAITIGSADIITQEDGSTTYEKAAYSNYGSDTNKIDYVTNGSYEYERTIEDEKIKTTTYGTSVSAAYVTSFIAMLKQLALTDNDNSNDMLSMNDVDASLDASAIKLDNESFFGKGYLSKDNINLVSSNKPDAEPLDAEDITIEDEDISLYTNAGNRSAMAAIIDGHSYINFTHPDAEDALNDIGGGGDVGWMSAMEFSIQLARVIEDNQTHTIVFNDCLYWADFTSRTLTKNKTIKIVDTDGKSGDGINCLGINPNHTNALFTISGGVNVKISGGAIYSEGCQESTNDSNITNLGTKTLKRPAISVNSNGTLTLENTSLRGSYDAAYVLNNHGTVTMTGGSIIGGANDSANHPLVINYGTLTIRKVRLNESYVGNNRNSTCIENYKSLTVEGSAVGFAMTGIKNTSQATKCEIKKYTTSESTISGNVGSGIYNAKGKTVDFTSSTIASNNGNGVENYGTFNMSGSATVTLGSIYLAGHQEK